ncbi:MAG: PLP-dependent transferase, partial [Jatrophihabitans sp.]
MDLHPDSLVVSTGRPHEPGDPLNTGIVPVTAYRTDESGNRYARFAVSPTVAAFEQVIGVLEGGRALAFSSGIAALAAVVDRLPVGSVVVVPDEGYSGTVLTFREHEALGRLVLRRVAPADTDAVRAACVGADLVWVETVSNPLMSIVDLPAVAAAAHEAGAVL